MTMTITIGIQLKLSVRQTDMEFVQNFTPLDFQAKILHRLFHLISTVLVKKKHKKWVKMEKFTPLAKILHCRRHWPHGQIPPLVLLKVWPMHYGIRADILKKSYQKMFNFENWFLCEFSSNTWFFWRGLSQHPKNWKTRKGIYKYQFKGV